MLQRINDGIDGPLDYVPARCVHTAIHNMRQPDALTDANFTGTMAAMAAILSAQDGATQCGDTASVSHGQSPALILRTVGDIYTGGGGPHCPKIELL